MGNNFLFTEEIFGELISERFFIPKEDLSLIFNKLNNADCSIKKAFLDVLEGNEIDCVVEGIHYKLLVEDLKMTPLAALLSLDWLIREPQNAMMAFRKDIVRWKRQGKIK